MLNINLTTSLKALGASCLLAFTSVAQAQITALSDDFESYGTAGTPSVADFSPWLGFSDNGGFPGGYVYTPSTSGPQISALGYNGTDNQYLNYYANYDNVNVHDRNACSPCSPNLQEEIFMYRQQSFSSADTASESTWIFTFNYREADVPPGGDTEVYAYIRVFDPIFNVLHEAKVDTSGSSTWQEGRLHVKLDSAWVDGFIQFGFANLTGGYDDSGMYYDDVNWFQPTEDDVNVNIVQGTVHPKHDGRDPNPNTAGGMFPDDVIAVIVYGASTGAGDTYNLNTDNIELDSVRFGPGSGPIDPGLNQLYGQNEDGDGIDDARFRFRMSSAVFDDSPGCTDDAGTITGELTTGETFSGTDAVTTNCNAACH